MFSLGGKYPSASDCASEMTLWNDSCFSFDALFVIGKASAGFERANPLQGLHLPTHWHFAKPFDAAILVSLIPREIHAADVDAVTKQIAVGFLDRVTEMNADAKLDAALERLGQRCAR